MTQERLLGVSGQNEIKHRPGVYLITVDGVVSGAWISPVIISEGYISDPLRVPLVLFSGHQDRSGTSDVILGHIAFI